jgi:hypothetical protein
MKAVYIGIMLVGLLLIAGCKSAPEEVVAPEPAPAPAPVEKTNEVTTEIAEQKADLSFESADETAQRLIKACEAGNAGLCAVLKNKYGIELEATVAAEEPSME